MKFPERFNAPRECDHDWQPVSMRFKTQLLDKDGRVMIRQPDLEEGRVYFICVLCACHTYMSTQWLGARMYGSEDAIQGHSYNHGYARPAWEPSDE